jgi:hypothetical protein
LNEDNTLVWVLVAVVAFIFLKRGGSNLLGNLLGGSPAYAGYDPYAGVPPTGGMAGPSIRPPAYVPGQVNPKTGVYSESGQYTPGGVYIDPKGTGSAYVNSGYGAFGKGGVFDQINTALVEKGLRPDSSGNFKPQQQPPPQSLPPVTQPVPPESGSPMAPPPPAPTPGGILGGLGGGGSTKSVGDTAKSLTGISRSIFHH